MAFTVKAKITGLEPQGNQTKVTFSANYTDDNGNRVNIEWAEATPGFSNTIWILNDIAERQALAVGDNFELLYTKEPKNPPNPAQGEAFGRQVGKYPGVRVDE